MPHAGRFWAAAYLAGLAATALASSACFDSRWFDMQNAKQAAVRNATPTALQATPAEGHEGPADGREETEIPPSRPVRVLKLRAHATPRYAAEVSDWPRQLAALLDDANRVLGPTVSVRLELASAERWTPTRSDDNLDAMSDELRSADPGQDADWVVGLVGSVPRLEQSFHQLGLGVIMGKHFIMRAMNDAREYDAIERELHDVAEQERRKLYHTRKRHKMTTVLLHELGHTLGALHEPAPRTIMSPHYDPKVEGYSAAAAELLRISLEHRLTPAAQTEQAFSKALIDHLDHTSSSWVPAERDAMVARLSASLAARAQPPAEDKRAAGAEADLTALREADRTTFKQAAEDQRAGRDADAWNKAKPLFSAYPDVYAVQDLRCQLAMKLNRSIDDLQAQCERLMQLTVGPRDKTKHK